MKERKERIIKRKHCLILAEYGIITSMLKALPFFLMLISLILSTHSREQFLKV